MPEGKNTVAGYAGIVFGVIFLPVLRWLPETGSRAGIE
jgi:hypothetical protein